MNQKSSQPVRCCIILRYTDISYYWMTLSAPSNNNSMELISHSLFSLHVCSMRSYWVRSNLLLEQEQVPEILLIMLYSYFSHPIGRLHTRFCGTHNVLVKLIWGLSIAIATQFVRELSFALFSENTCIDSTISDDYVINLLSMPIVLFRFPCYRSPKRLLFNTISPTWMTTSCLCLIFLGSMNWMAAFLATAPTSTKRRLAAESMDESGIWINGR